jgi:hypothetical protein
MTKESADAPTTHLRPRRFTPAEFDEGQGLNSVGEQRGLKCETCHPTRLQGGSI